MFSILFSYCCRLFYKGLMERFMRVVGKMAPDYFASSYARDFWPEQCGGRTSLESCTKQRYTPLFLYIF